MLTKLIDLLFNKIPNAFSQAIILLVGAATWVFKHSHIIIISIVILAAILLAIHLIQNHHNNRRY